MQKLLGKFISNLIEFLDKEDVIEKKNVFMVPLFRDLKSTIRHMTNTEDYKILKDFTTNRNIILANYVLNF